MTQAVRQRPRSALAVDSLPGDKAPLRGVHGRRGGDAVCGGDHCGTIVSCSFSAIETGDGTNAADDHYDP